VPVCLVTLLTPAHGVPVLPVAPFGVRIWVRVGAGVDLAG